MDDEWDLHAVVRSCTTISTTNTTTDDYDDGFDNMEILTSRDDINSLYSYTASCEHFPSEGLEDVYKEGCSIVTPLAPSLITSTVYVDEEDELPAMDSFSIETPSRKRKNQQKKMVVELTQEELCSDTWAWRKYGQKPIKGSPFPRNYYKCSTMKTCGARKQVEQSHTDPTTFIVSYSGEHIHPRPTHRSPLAGSTRSNKFTTTNMPPTTCDDTTHS